jgi:hypothetical protein
MCIGLQCIYTINILQNFAKCTFSPYLALNGLTTMVPWMLQIGLFRQKYLMVWILSCSCKWKLSAYITFLCAACNKHFRYLLGWWKCHKRWLFCTPTLTFGLFYFHFSFYSVNSFSSVLLVIKNNVFGVRSCFYWWNDENFVERFMMS